MWRRILCFALFLALSASGNARAVIQDICTEYTNSDLIFRGTVIDVTAIPDPVLVRPANADPNQLIEDLPLSSGKVRVRFSIGEIFRGDVQQEITLTSYVQTECAIQFNKGTQYLVFAYLNKETGELQAGGCMHTAQFDPAIKNDDVTWMHARAKASGGLIEGGASIDQRLPLQGAKVSLRGPVSRDLILNANGGYSVDGLPPGQYTAAITLPPSLLLEPYTPSPVTLELEKKGCAIAGWEASYDSHIRGTVTDAYGKPVQNIGIDYMHPPGTKSYTGYTDGEPAGTDAGGHYDLHKTPPGSYLIVANSMGADAYHPYPRVYYPNTVNIENAVPVTIGPAGTLEHIDFQLPTFKSVTIHMAVKMPDGTPAAGAQIYARDNINPGSVQPASAVTDADGQASLSLYDEHTYCMMMFVTRNGMQQPFAQMPLIAKDGLQASATLGFLVSHDCM